MRLTDLAFFFEPTQIPNGGGDSAKIALYGMIAAIVVAIIGAVGAAINKVLGNKIDSSSPTANVKRVAKQAEAWERFFLLQGIDPRKVKTGYESMEEVRRAPAA